MKSATRVALDGRTMVVTGTSPGSIGFETARILASWGATVLVSTRSGTEANAAAIAAAAGNGQVHGRTMDLTDAASVTAFADWATSSHAPDVLINNAGIHLDLRSAWKQPHLVDGEEIHWRTNYLGTMQLTKQLLPALLASAARTGDARVVNVVSKLHTRATNAQLFTDLDPYHSWTAYGRSKLALIHAANEIQRRYADQGLQGYALHPGAVYSNIADRGLEGHRVIGALRRAFAPLERRTLLSVSDGAQTTVHCATDPVARGGQYYRALAVAQASADTADAGAASRLWVDTDAWLAAHT